MRIPEHAPVAPTPSPVSKPHRVVPAAAVVHAAAPPPREHTPAAPAVDCNPPYYFQGDKKIFKPACI
jgi:serine/threonine-protein kinase